MTCRKNRINFRYQLMCNIGWMLLTGSPVGWLCCCTTNPQSMFIWSRLRGVLTPRLIEKRGLQLSSKKGVAVTIKPIDEIELFALTEDPKLNPYLIVERDGAVEPIYTVFEIIVHNREHRRVVFDDTALLIDANGAQYANLSNDLL